MHASKDSNPDEWIWNPLCYQLHQRRVRTSKTYLLRGKETLFIVFCVVKGGLEPPAEYSAFTLMQHDHCGRDLRQRRITPTSRFFCVWHSTVASSSYLAPSFTECPEYPNDCYSTTRNQVTDVLRERLELSRLSAPDPKSSVTTNFTTQANCLSFQAV